MSISTSKMVEEVRQQPAALERMLKADWKGIEALRKRLEKQRPR